MDERLFWYLQGVGSTAIVVLLLVLFYQLRGVKSHASILHGHILFLLNEVESEKADRLHQEERGRKKKHSKTKTFPSSVLSCSASH